MKYKFIGKPDMVFPHLVHGKVYDLEIEEYWNSRGLFVGNVAPTIVSPIKCPYSSWEMFYLNWQKLSNKEGIK